MKKKLLLIVAALSLVAFMAACTDEDMEAFESGFEAGWNSTAPSEYWI